MATMAQVIADVAETIAGITGIRQAPADPQEQYNVFPFAVVYPGDGNASFGVIGERLNLDTVIVELHVARKDLSRDVALALPYVDSIPNALMLAFTTDFWGATIDTFESIDWTFGELGWGGMQTLGFRFSVNGVKRRVNIS